MNDSIKRISLDIHSTSSGETVNAKRGDTARKIIISLVDGGLPYIIGEDCYAVFTGKKPDRNVVFNDCTIKDNTIIYEFTEQTVAVEGRVNCEIKLYGADGKLITSPKFTICVFGTVYNEGDEVESTDEFNALTSLIASTQKAVKEAQEAVEEAQEAIKVAQEMEALLYITDASGSPVVVDDAAEHSLIGLKIYGKTTQNGTPAPDAPVDLVSVGDSGSITVNVNDEQSMVIATPNGLPGIPVISGGNYIDADGQQWICDEIDLSRRVRVQRAFVKTFNGTENWAYDSSKKYFMLSHSVIGSVTKGLYFSSHFVRGTTSDNGVFFSGTSGFAFYHTAESTAEWKEFLSEQFANGTPVKLAYILATPIETPLSKEELAAYATLHSYRNSTTVSNDAGAWMDLEYAMDAKKYIDQFGIDGITSARISQITIHASKWTGSNSLYSQVVNINGITPYSKVDLLPSVEQLAIFHDKDVAFVTENEDGVVTVYAIGDKPTQDYTMQVSITEVSA